MNNFSSVENHVPPGQLLRVIWGMNISSYLANHHAINCFVNQNTACLYVILKEKKIYFDVIHLQDTTLTYLTY